MNLRRTALLSWIGHHRVSLDDVVYDCGPVRPLRDGPRCSWPGVNGSLFLMSSGAVLLLTRPRRWVAC